MPNRSRRPRIVLLLLVWLAAGVGPALAQKWRPVPGRLLTEFAKRVDPENVLPEYPRPALRRDRWMNLNGLWEFAIAKEGDSPPLGRRLAERILVPFPVESALSGQGRRAERVWYRRTFEVPPGWAGMRVLLHFGAADWETTVWVNGKTLGRHRGGYDAFTFDLTGALRERGPQELVVGVWDPTDGGRQARGKQVSKPHGIWYTPTTGIWQTVWLEPVPAASIERLVIVPDVDHATVRVRAEGRGTDERHTLVVEVPADPGSGEAAATGSGRVGEEIAISIRSPRLWSPGSPHLYPLVVSLRDEQREVDRVASYFGLRKVEVGEDDDGITRILLNGKPLFQLGPLDQGFWPDGLYTAPTEEALNRDIVVMKNLGFNMVRKHVKIEPARWYFWCDRLGLLVWQDMPSGDAFTRREKKEIERTAESARQFEAELRQLVEQHQGHPSIVMWIVFNEGWGQYDTKRLAGWVKQLDPTRLVSAASGWHDFAGVGDVHDIHAYPGPAAPKPEANRAAVLGEFGGLGLPIRGHTWQDEKNWGYRNLKSREALDAGYLRLIESLRFLIARPGLSAAVYTQLTDVETEVNGLMTYDRAQVKVDAERVARAHRTLYGPPPRLVEVTPTSRDRPVAWRYTAKKPAEGWFRPGFDDQGWAEGPGGFGRKGTPGAVVRTEWTGSDIWLRRRFELGEVNRDRLHLEIHHDEDVEVYLNGVLAARRTGYTVDYIVLPIRPEARAALRAGANVMAVHCRQTGGGQYVDMGLLEVVERRN
jgi:hypothetical protein